MRTRINFLKPVFVITICLSPLIGAAQAKKPIPLLLPLDKAVRTGKLPNGFTYFIRHNTEPKNRVYLYLVNKVGSILENDNQRGLAHFMEHMSFNGTKHYPKNALVDYLQKSGVRFGADLNAYTSFDETVYQLPLPTDNQDILKNGFRIMRDWAQEATLDPSEINQERGVVLEEKRLGKGAGERIQRLTLPILLNHSRYADRLPIGTDEVLNNFKQEAIKSFYRDWYRPDLQGLVVVGDIDVNATEKIIKAQFASLKNPAKERMRTKYKIALDGQNHFLAVTDPELTNTSIELLIKHKRAAIKTKTDYRNAIAQQLFNQMLAERYQELARKADVPFVNASAGIQDFMGGLDSYGASMTAKPGELEKGFKALWRETERVSRFGFTATELDRAKESYLSAVSATLKEKDKTPSESFVKEYQQYFLDGSASPGIQAEYQLTTALLPAITLSEVNSLTKNYIKNTNRDIIIQAPEKEKSRLPDEKTVLTWIASVGSEHLIPYTDESVAQPLLATQPIPGKIVAEKLQKEQGVTELTLSNGLKVVLKPTTFKNNEVSFTAFAPGGTSLYSDADFQSVANAPVLIPAGGLGNLNTTQLQKKLAGKQVGVQPFIGERAQGISGQSTAGDLETALQLTYLYFTGARKDTAMFRNIIIRSAAGIAERANDPNSVFQDTLSAVMGNYNPRRTGPTLAKLAQIDLDKAFAAFRQRFADAAGFTFIFVGSFDVEKIKPLLEQYLGSLPANRRNEQAVNLHIHAPEGQISRTVYKGTEPKATVRMVFTGPYEFNTFNNNNLNALTEVLEIRLLERLREQESGVYSPSCSAGYTKLPDNRYSLSIAFGCAPQNVDKLIASALDEIALLRKDGPAQVNLIKYKAEHNRSMETALKTNDFWLNYLNRQYQDGEPLDQVFHDREDMAQVTTETIKDAANRFLDGKNYIRLVLMPEEKK